MPQAQTFLSEQEQLSITQAIREAEKKTSGEIRIHIEPHCKEDVMDRAAYVFEKLSMHTTQLRNGVLFYIAYKDKQIAILGDAGINTKVPENFWDSIYATMRTNFAQGDFVKGLQLAINEAGNQLAEHFPCKSDDINELSNEISFDV